MAAVWLSVAAAGKENSWVFGSRRQRRPEESHRENRSEKQPVGLLTFLYGGTRMRIFCPLLLSFLSLPAGLVQGQSVSTVSSSPAIALDKSTVVGVMDAPLSPPEEPHKTFSTAVVRSLQAAGVKVRTVAPGALAESADRLDVLIWNGPSCAEDDATPLERYLQSGKAVWFVSSSPVLSRFARKNAAGQWEETKHPRPLWVYRALCLPGDGSESARLPDDLADPEFSLTEEGAKWFGFLGERIPVVASLTLEKDNSIHRLVASPGVKIVRLLACRYRAKNWIHQEDTFTANPIVLFLHQAGRFRGARVLFTGLSTRNRSPLNPESPSFDPMVRICVSRLAKPLATREISAVIDTSKLPPLTRRHYFRYPYGIAMPICFDGPDIENPRFWEDMKTFGFNAIHTNIPWYDKTDAAGEVVDWKRMDTIVATAKQHGYPLVIDPYTFFWGSFQWTTEQSVHNSEFLQRFCRVMRHLARRYKEEPTVVGLYATPHTNICNFGVETSPPAVAAWREYVKRKYTLEQVRKQYGLAIQNWQELPLPRENPREEFNAGPMWSDYVEFFLSDYKRFLRTVIQTIREETPDMPIFLRGGYLEGASFSVASEFKNVAPHIECMETTIDTEGYFRSLGLRFGVPISGENGWPKLPEGPARMAIADLLMGGYVDWHYSFGGPTFAVSSAEDYARAFRPWSRIKQARYAKSRLGLLIPDTTQYASRPPNFFSIEKVPHLEYALERLGFPFEGVSAQFPRLDGLKVVLDDGGNAVLSRSCMETLQKWIQEEGGTLVGFRGTGKYALDGGRNLWSSLGVDDRKTGMHPLGKGQILLLERHPSETELAAVLSRLKLPRDVRIEPYLSNATWHRGNRSYLVLFNKQPAYVGSFFTESRLESIEASLPSVRLTIQPGFAFRSARELITNRPLANRNGSVVLVLPPTRFAVIEFRR